ncbi:MAG TPA: iron-containing alcohol dehydrogenase [Bacteroidales bacterium]
MVKNFEFSRLPKIYFKNGKFSDLPGIIRSNGNKIIVVTGKSSFINSGNGMKFFHDLRKAGIGYDMITISGEPSPGIIDQTVNMLNKKDIDLVVGIGGGSVLDAGKAISAMMFKTESVVDYLEGVGTMEHPGTKLPYIAVPTTSGTGSEATKNAVISAIGKDGFKKSLRHENLVPDIALIDPELTLHCPEDITAASGMDCFTQLTESYLSDKSNEYTDALALEGIKAIKTSLIRTCTDGEDIEARSEMSFAALSSGICLTNAGLGVVHGFASSVGGMYDIPHGLICGTLMARSNEVNIRELRKQGNNPGALRKYSILGKLFLGDKGKKDNYYIDGFIQYLYKLTDDLHLGDFNKNELNKKDIRIICSKTEMKNNPVKLNVDDLTEILLKSLRE